MRKILKRKVSVFGKGIPVFVFVLLGLALVGAALLSYYGSITGNAVVSQSVVLNNKPCTTEDACTELGAWNGPFVAGDFVSDCDNSVKNNANVPATINFTTTCENSTGSENCTGITTEVYGVLNLTSKNASWNPTANRKATLYYTIVGNQFKYKVNVTAGVLTDYVVVYYPDISATGTDGEGKKPWNYANAVNLGAVSNVWTISSLTTSLPATGDYNANPNKGDSYCSGENGFDHYEHCAGAKIWMMPSSDFTAMQGGTWNPTAWLFETDLIVYSNSTANKITLPSKGGFNFCVDNEFAINLKPDTYTIITEIKPVTA